MDELKQVVRRLVDVIEQLEPQLIGYGFYFDGGLPDRHDGREVGTLTGHTWGLLMAISGYVHMAIDMWRRPRAAVGDPDV